MSLSLPASLVSTEWLAAHLDHADLVVLDGSFKLPGVTPIAAEDFAARHIPSARFFDIDEVADHDTWLPHMLPSPIAFERYAADLGISNDSDRRLRHTRTDVGGKDLVDPAKLRPRRGGDPRWRAEEMARRRPAGNFRATFDPKAVRSRSQVLDNLNTRAEQIIDARSAGRFTAQEKEARPGLRSGHIPGSLNLPFNALTDPATGELLPVSDIRKAFETAGLDFSRPVIARCGSGVTAAALAFGLHLAGKQDVAIYDGAWTEWGQPGRYPRRGRPGPAGKRPMSVLSPTLFGTLAQPFGDRFSTSQALREQHGGGESHHAVAVPDAVVFAQTTEDVAEIVRLCAEHGVPVIAYGAGTSLEGHPTAVRGGIAIDLSWMSQVLRVSAEDLDCTVQAGVTREQLNTYLRDIGLFFPIDPGANASIGGMAATRASGTNAVCYGTMRENVLSVTVVLPSGQVIRTGGRARKSSAGYDLTGLFVGSEGTLGIITEVTLRLYGIPETISAALCSFESVEQRRSPK